MTSRAFTLIELLVVVLIIGILAAIALPQYKVSVGKAKFMELIAVGDAVHKAEEIHYMENLAYTNDVDSLVLALPYNGYLANIDILVSSDAVVVLRYDNLGPYYVFYLDQHPLKRYRGLRECRVDSKKLTTTNKQICASLTGRTEVTGNKYSYWRF